MNERIVTVAHFLDAAEAYRFQMHLDEAGIISSVVGQQTHALIPTSAFGVQLQIRASDLEKAVEVLKEKVGNLEGDIDPELEKQAERGLLKHVLAMMIRLISRKW